MAGNADNIPQKYYDENRQRFDADTSSFDLQELRKNRCDHFFRRRSWGEVECQKCHIGYSDAHRFIIENGKLVGIK